MRKLKHKNGKIYIQVVEKSNGKYVVKKSFGSVQSESHLNDLMNEANLWIKHFSKIQELDFVDERTHYLEVLSSITAHKLVGIELVLGKIFDEIGFNLIQDELFKDLVLYRLVYPRSKLKTTEYLYRFAQKNYTEDDIYRYMDKLYHTQKEAVQKISYEHTLKVLPSGINLVFYDVTTLYFETDYEDDLRKTGFSKEGKHQNPQIVLGLLVSEGGYPLAYDIFEGKQYEAHTILPVIQEFRDKFSVEKLVVVADAGLLSQANVEALIAQKCEFILGARIKNEAEKIKQEILSLSLQNGESKIIKKGDLKLIITYSDQREKKDKYNREKGLKRLEKSLATGKLTKSNINSRGYNKFLKMDGEIDLTINPNKVKEDQKWDGLKGYITNSTLSKEKILESYHQLWQIEKAFRIAKTDLRIRPIFHYKQRRIEAHICLNFVAYKVYKELERQLKEKRSDLSPEKVIEILQSIYEIEVTTAKLGEKIRRVLLLTQEHRLVFDLFRFGC